MKLPYAWTKVLSFAAAALVSTLAVSAAQPSDASVKELLELSGSAHQIEAAKAQFSGMEANAIQQALKGHEITPDIQKILEDSAAKASSIINSTLDWAKVEPLFVKAYQATLTQDEVNGIVAFYKTPAGKAMVQKLPVLMQQTMMEMRPQLGAMMGQLKQVQQQTALKLQAEFVKQG
ncbi:hypothetical protein GALL_141490 [mine drainage metagenome]|uniref:DUF2059 domain-containing protein n=1 Tax=mine drainage metagenome TaxID=410659 RepID=A0A1J5SQ22_9ZZZZ